jgi:hypothetical protein
MPIKTVEIDPNRKSCLDNPMSPLMFVHPIPGHALGFRDLEQGVAYNVTKLTPRSGVLPPP